MIPHLLHQPYLDEPYWTLQVGIRFYVLMFLLLLLRKGAWLIPFAVVWLGLSVIDWVQQIPVLHVQLTLDNAPFSSPAWFAPGSIGPGRNGRVLPSLMPVNTPISVS